MMGNNIRDWKIVQLKEDDGDEEAAAANGCLVRKNGGTNKENF
jgi:hypothetical protein